MEPYNAGPISNDWCECTCVDDFDSMAFQTPNIYLLSENIFHVKTAFEKCLHLKGCNGASVAALIVHMMKT